MLVHGGGTHLSQLGETCGADPGTVRESAEHIAALLHQAYHCRAQKDVPRPPVAHQIVQPLKVCRFQIPGREAAAGRWQMEQFDERDQGSMAPIESEAVGEVAVVFKAGAPVVPEQERVVSSTFLPETDTVLVVLPEVVEQTGVPEIRRVVRVEPDEEELRFFRARALIRLLTEEFAQFFARMKVVGQA